MLDKWRNYAIGQGKIKEIYIRKYSSRNPKRQAREASGCNSLLGSREVQSEVKEEIVPIVNNACVEDTEKKPRKRRKKTVKNP